MHMRKVPSFSLANRTGVLHGDGLDLMKPLSNNSCSRVDTSGGSLGVFGKYLWIFTNDQDVVNLLLLGWLLGDESQNSSMAFTSALLHSHEGYDTYGCTTPFALGQREFLHSGEEGDQSSHY
ncbi:hypothetical protein L1987_27611 [Smallanthus sonchifolius]|uniref:Uncharacterized protein n=1 Tax=Smallanthus sonchifolius TaxID=185202 RepID=A0ACB9IE21_9ASTR|nr:hypothetical protein L1987_27611 [Smallanthus sonchifolius]